MAGNRFDEPEVELNETARLEAFSDGVFAIAITLLILEIRVPEQLPPDTRLWQVLLEQWTSYVSFLAGFSTIGIMWINHHRLFNLIGRSDDWLLIWNLLLLLTVTFINFPTALLGQYLGTPEATTAMVLYTATTVVVSLAFNFVWRHAVRANLLYRRVDPAAVAAISRSYLFGPVIYMLALGLTFISVPVTLAIMIGLALFWALPVMNPLTRR